MENKGEISDGYHTFNELYEHRNLLFISLMKLLPEKSWRANNHADGTMYDGWFIAGMQLSTGQITYHLPVRMWELLDGANIQTSNMAPEYDGHTPNDVLDRLKELIKNER